MGLKNKRMNAMWRKYFGFLCLGTLCFSFPAHGESRTWTQPMTSSPLPGQLDNWPVVHSNSPEWVTQPGILVSTLPWAGEAHLAYPLNGDFGLFLHHVVRYRWQQDPWHLAVVAYNPSQQPVYLTQHWGSTALTKPDAPFIPLPALSSAGVFAGPGDRVTQEIVQGQGVLRPAAFLLPPEQLTLLHGLSLPDFGPWPFERSNARSLLAAWRSSGEVHLAVLAAQSPAFPSLETWDALLRQGKLAGAREATPTAYEPGQSPPQGVFRYGRVAGVAEGLHWDGVIPAEQWPLPGAIHSWPLSSVYLKRLGTAQNQSAPLLRRYSDTAWQSHGNYGVRYRLQLSGRNSTDEVRRWQLRLSQPHHVQDSQAHFSAPPQPAVRFRGTVRLWWGNAAVIDTHMVLQEGQRGEPFALLELGPHSQDTWTLEVIYPPDATPPQLLELEGLSF